MGCPFFSLGSGWELEPQGWPPWRAVHTGLHGGGNGGRSWSEGEKKTSPWFPSSTASTPLTGGFLMSTRHWCVSGTSGTQILAPRTWTRQLPAALIPGKQHRAQAAHWKDGSTSYLWGNWLDLWRPIQAGRNWARLAIKSTMPSKDNLNSY